MHRTTMIRQTLTPLFLAALLSTAIAATPPSPAPVSVLSDSLVLPVTASSSRLALPSTAASAYAVTICNTGAKDGYFALGSVTVNATTAHNLVRAGSGVALFSNGAAYIAGIAGGSDTTTFTVYQGNGPLAQCPASAGSGGGGAITGNVGILNTGATQIDPATAQRQDTGNTSLGTIATNTTGAATAVNQTTANGSLSIIAGAVTSSVVQSNTKQVNGVTTQAGAGAAGTGSQRVAVAQDTTTVAGSAPGTAGAPSTNVLTVQGAPSMTKLLVTPDSVALPANQSVNIAQLNGAAPSLTNPIYTANAEAADVSGTFTNGTQTNSVTNTSADGYAAGLISINGTYGTASGVFEASDDGGTTWYSIVCGRSDGTASETGYTALTNVSRQWSCPVGGNDSIRVRSTAVASGTANLRVGISAPPPSSTVTTGNVTVTQAAAASLNAQVVGAVASAGANAGNPVKLGGVVATAQPSLSNGNVNDVLMSSKGGIIITPQFGVAVTTGSVNVGLYDQAGNTRTLAVGSTLYNGSTNDAALSAVNGLNSTGTGIQDTANVDQFDDVSPTTITENQFGHVRMSTNRNQYGTIRDAAGNERGLNIDSHNSAQTVQYDSSGNPIDYTQNINVGPGPGGRVDVSCATGNVAAAIATCTMPATTGKTTYVAGFDISGSGATIGSVVTCTLTNTNSGTLSYTFAAAAGVLLADTPLSKNFAPPLKATATNTAPVLSCPSLGTGNTNMTINAYGYEL